MELHIPPEEELIDPKEEPQDVVENPQVEERRVETTTQAESSREAQAKKVTNRYTSYMALMTELVEVEPSSFEEELEKPIWVDAMVEEYKFIVKKSVLEVVPRLADKSVVSLRWIFKVKQAANGSIEKYKARFFAKGYSQVEGIDYEDTFSLIARYSSI
eukprot:PITA_27917